MIHFSATAFNEKGDTFGFSFSHANWNGVERAAREALNEFVEGDPFHQKNGPWFFRNLDRCA